MSKINIIVPVYNVDKYLDAFFESLLNQTFQDYTLFVIDDCSTDNSSEIVKLYKQRFGEKLLYFRNEKNMLLGKTRNRGLEEAEKFESEYTTFLDSDDWIDACFLENLYHAAIQQDCDIVICGIQRFEDTTNRHICTESVNGPTVRRTDLFQFDELAYINPAVYNKLFRSSKIKGYRFRPMKRSEDTCYFFEILPEMNSLIYTNKATYHYRIRESSLTGTFGNDVCKSMYDGFKDMYKLYQMPKYIGYKEMFETQVFIRCAVGGVCRASFSDMRTTWKNAKEAYSYMNIYMPDWRKNKYLCFCKMHNGNWKQFALKCCALAYKCHLFGIVVWCYYFFLKILKKDVRM